MKFAVSYQLRTRRVVVAVAPHLVGRIAWSPPLPTEKKLLAENLPIGHLIKYILIYKKVLQKWD